MLRHLLACAPILGFLVLTTPRVSAGAGKELSSAIPDGNSRVPDSARFETPLAVAASRTHVYVADYHENRIHVFTRDGDFVRAWGTRGGGPGELDGPTGIATDASGNVYVADFHNHRVQKFSSKGELLAVWGSRGEDDGKFGGPFGVAVDEAGRVFVTDLDHDRVQVFASDGAFLWRWGASGSGAGELADPLGVAVGPGGEVYVADHGNDRIQRFAADGTPLGAWSSEARSPDGLRGPVGVAVGSRGEVYATDLVGHRVLSYEPDGTPRSTWTQPQDDPTPFRFPNGLGVDDAGYLLVADATNRRVRRWSTWTIEDVETRAFRTFTLSPAWPNPSTGPTTLRFGAPHPGRLRVKIHDVRGRVVRDLGESFVAAGEHWLTWDGRTASDRPAPMGIYFVHGRYDDGTGWSTVKGRVVLLR